jgi:hypothetical protein
METEKPYFMKNEEWYSYDKENDVFTMSEKAPVEAIISYQAYIESVNLENDLFTEIFGSEKEKEQKEKRIMELDYLISQPEASKKYDEEQQAKQIYGGF